MRPRGRSHFNALSPTAGSPSRNSPDRVGDPILEPALLGTEVRAAYLIEDEGLVNPSSLLESLLARLRSLSVVVTERSGASGFVVERGRVRAAVVDGRPLDCSRVVVASGTWSADVLALLGVSLRLQAGKGYSFSVDLAVPPRRPLYLGDKHVAVSPLGSSTRIAGTMEFSGNNLRLDWRRVEAIAPRAASTSATGSTTTTT